MKTGAIICLALFVMAALLILVQLWLAPFDQGLFIKLLITLGIGLLITLAVTLVRKEYIEDKAMKEKGYID